MSNVDLTGIEVTVPRLPDGLVEMVRAKVDPAWEAALAMKGAEIRRRGRVGDYGEPGLAVIVRWHYDGAAEPGPDTSLPIRDLDLIFAESEDDPGVSSFLHMFEEGEEARDRFTAGIIARLHNDHTRRLTGARPFAALEDDELDALSHDSYAPARVELKPEGLAALKAHAIGQFAFMEYCLRDDGESAHQAFVRESEQRARRRLREDAAPGQPRVSDEASKSRE